MAKGGVFCQGIVGGDYVIRAEVAQLTAAACAGEFGQLVARPLEVVDQPTGMPAMTLRIQSILARISWGVAISENRLGLMASCPGFRSRTSAISGLNLETYLGRGRIFIP